MPFPTPEPGLVIRYAYLWHSEYEVGHEEGNKDRPSAIGLSAVNNSGEIVGVLLVRKISSSSMIALMSKSDLVFLALPLASR